MCFNPNRIRQPFRYNWVGDQIVSPLVTAARRVPGNRRTSLAIDVREFLAIDHSAEIREFFLREIVAPCPASERERFFLAGRGTFDWRMRQVIDAFRRFRYRPVQGRGREEWLLPAETLANGGGDCEDLAFLLMSLLQESGISNSCLRVVFGRIEEYDGGRKRTRHDHAWVMYQLEGGAWMILDPVEHVERRGSRRAALRSRVPNASATYEYQPLFVFNRDHLWLVHGPKEASQHRNLDSYLGRRRFWAHYNPAFALSVHNGIYDEAMPELSWSDMFAVKVASLALDANVLDYDPRDHCDFGYLQAGWDRVKARLASGSILDLGCAVHTAADFYAHSLYAHVTAPVAGRLPLYDPTSPVDPGTKQDVVFDRSRFSINNKSPALTEDQTRAYFAGKLVSGQWWRWYTTYPDELKAAAELGPRRCLPDHDLMAVDDEAAQDNPAHLYPTKDLYNAQFSLRRNAAIRHVRSLYLQWQQAHG